MPSKPTYPITDSKMTIPSISILIHSHTHTYIYIFTTEKIDKCLSLGAGICPRG